LKIQKTYKYIIFLLGGILFFGALLDAISNSISLITFPIAVLGTIIISVTWIILEITASKKGLKWSLPGGKKTVVRKINNQVKFFFIGIIITLWIPFFLKPFLSNESTKLENTEEKRKRRNVHDLALYITHYLSSLLDSSNPKFFDLKVRQIDSIKLVLEKHLEFIDIDDKIKIPTDTLDSRNLFEEMVKFERKEIKPKIRINLGEPYFYQYFLSRNMWQYEYFFNIFKKTNDPYTKEALKKMRVSITDLSNKVNFDIDKNELLMFLDNPTTESIDKIIINK